MNSILVNFDRLLRSPEGLLEVVAPLVISICVTVIFAAVAINFLSYGQTDGIKRKRKSIVATGTMTAFFFCFYLVIRMRIGEVAVAVPWSGWESLCSDAR